MAACYNARNVCYRSLRARQWISERNLCVLSHRVGKLGLKVTGQVATPILWTKYKRKRSCNGFHYKLLSLSCTLYLVHNIFFICMGVTTCSLLL